MKQKNKKKIFLLSLFCFCGLVSCVSHKKQIKKSYFLHDMAVSLMKQCQYNSALGELKKALKLKQKDPLLHNSIALVYLQFKKYKQAIFHFEKALQLQPNFTEARVHLGWSLIEVESLNRAESELKKALKDLTYRNSENIHTHLGLLFYKRGNFQKAEKHFSVARKIKTKDCFTALYHARSFYFLNQFSDALKILRPAKKWCEIYLPICSSPNFDAYFFTALVYKKMKQDQKALENLKIFLQKNPESSYLAEAKRLIVRWRKQ